MNDVLGEAIMDYHQGFKRHKLWIHNRYGRKEEMPVSIYFRNVEDMPEMEKLALQYCNGKVLDIGAGAGTHSLLLQKKKLNVTALDISAKALEVAKMRGVKKTWVQNFFDYKAERFDTLLLLMNGIGLCGNLEGLHHFLQHAKTLIGKGGQIIFDSSDVAYLFKKNPKPAHQYYGEIEYQYAYKRASTPWFNWLYIDAKTLTDIASANGWHTTIIMEDDYDQYLARLTLKGF